MIQIIDTGVANIRSLQAAFDRLGQSWHLTQDANDVIHASHVVLPGVGAIAAAAERLDQLQLRDALKERVSRPELSTLCICLGMQLLCDSSDESDTAKGLGVLPFRIKRFPETVAVPQLGWNLVSPSRGDQSGALPYEPGEAYFANSFRLVDVPGDDWGYATTDYGGPFVSSFWRDNILACQFHPELSGTWGASVLQHWVNRASTEKMVINQGESEC